MHHLKKTAKASSQEKVLKNSSNLRRLLAATLFVSGALQLLPTTVLAAGLAAGTQIKNTATATYEDSSQPGVTINATSNTVTVSIAEVAGITVVNSAINDSTPATPVLPTDVLTYDFLITNVGNDTTKVTIPAPVITGPATASGTITYDIDANGDGTFETLGTTLAAAQAAILAPNGAIKVHVPVTVDLSATSGAPIKVQLGDTGANDNSAGTQNQPVAGANNVATFDAPDATSGETAGAPTNGEREASAVGVQLVGANPQAFAAILKTQGAYSNSGTPLDFSDDLETYNLSLRVDSAAPAGASPSLTPADLTGTAINLDGTPNTIRVLVSDAIPAQTVLNATPTAPAGWTVVYSISPTTGGSATNGNNALWTTTAPGTLSTTTRVGFINNGPITKGTTVNGFAFQVKTTGLTTPAGGTIYNIAQLFGTSAGGTTVAYDESGDSQPSNFNADGSAGPGPNGVGASLNGVANPNADGIDSAGNNTGTGVGGEDNALVLAPAGAILNGPLNSPAAVGPTDNNDDFTDKSTTIAAGILPGATIDPDPLTFTNTLNAPSTTLTNVLVRPVAPAVATDLPTNTTATLTYGSQTAVYTYNGTQFVFTSGVAIQIPTIPGNSSVNYTVVVDLPANTALSTDTSKGYPVPILAFSDLNSNGILDVGTESSNKTIDRVYTGFLKLDKTSLVLQGSGPAVLGADGTESTLDKKPSPGNIVQYFIRYKNIATAPVGTANTILDAKNVVITESGVLNTAVFPLAPNGNNWGQDYNPNGVIDTSHVTGTATDSGTGSTITFFAGTTASTSVTEQSGATPTTDVTKYVNTLSVPVSPGSAARLFTFQRKLN